MPAGNAVAAEPAAEGDDLDVGPGVRRLAVPAPLQQPVLDQLADDA